MALITKADIKRELVTRQARKAVGFDISKYLFPEQLAFVNDQSPYATAVCSRRAGKTEGIVYDLLREAVTKDNITALYLTLSRSNAKKLVWSKLLEVNRRHKLNGEINISELSLTFPNKSVIYVSGAKDKVSIERFRGLALSLCYIDEAQSFGLFIRELVDDVISKALFDHNGRLKLTGTPGPVPAGYFYDVAHSKEWSHHKWTMHQNPYLIQKGNNLTIEDLIAQDIKRKGVTISDPGIRREIFGEWVTDLNSLVFKYNENLNNYQDLPFDIRTAQTVIGIDTGYNDADSITVVAWHEDCAEAFLVEEIIQSKQTFEQLSTQIRDLDAKYKPMRTVIDPAAGGTKFAQELNQRFGLSIEAAEKTRKLEFVELMNDALRTGRFKAKRTSQFAQDCQKIEWAISEKTQKRIISHTFHSDAADSTLYAFRAAQHWLFNSPEAKPLPNTPDWYRAEAKRLEDEAIAAYHKRNDPFDFDPSDF